MQPALIFISVLALLAPTVRVSQTKMSASGLQQRRADFGAPQHSSEVAAIEAYTKMLDRYFKSHLRLTHFYVDALPEGKADESSGAGRDWHEVKNQNAMLDAEREYATHSIAVSEKDGEIVYADIAEPLEHSRRDDGYYFRRDGTLAKISSDFYSNMAGVHITQETFYGAGGKPLSETAQCFNVITTSKGSREKRASCGRPEMKAALSDYKLSVYTKNTDLPGYEILKRR